MSSGGMESDFWVEQMKKIEEIQTPMKLLKFAASLICRKYEKCEKKKEFFRMCEERYKEVKTEEEIRPDFSGYVIEGSGAHLGTWMAFCMFYDMS